MNISKWLFMLNYANDDSQYPVAGSQCVLELRTLGSKLAGANGWEPSERRNAASHWIPHSLLQRHVSLVLLEALLFTPYVFNSFFRLKHNSLDANFENVILGCPMTTLESKSTTPLSQLILIKPDKNVQISCEIVSNIGQTLVQKLYICQRKTGEQGNLCNKIRKKNPEKSLLLFFICLKLND